MASDFAKEVRDLFTQAEEADRENCEEAITDLKFEGFDQWDPQVRADRENRGPFPLPCLTINTAQQYTSLVVGDWLANETSIKVLPREDGDVTVADVRSELIRSIELQSKADRVYASSLGQMASCGISNFRVDIDYAYEDAFERDLFIRDIPNPLAVKWDPLAFDPTGRDAKYCFVGDEVTDDDYKKRFPKAARPTLIQKEAGSSWATGKTVMLPEYWKIEERTRTIGMTKDGKTVDLTGMARNKWPQLAIDPETKEPIIRDDAKCKWAVMVLTNGVEELTDPLELRLHRLPIIRVMGREVWTGEKRVRFGLVRCMRDSQRMKNYMRSVRAELLMRMPRVNFIAPAKTIEGREEDWENTLVYNDNAGAPPLPVTTANLSALLNEEQMFAQDMMDTTGLHEASRGMPSNETSGVAIKARQQEGDVATIILHHNMVAAQMEAGEVLDALIPTVFDTARTIRTVGPDLGVKMVRINDPKDEKNVDIGTGRYDVTISTGPAYMTRRQETSDMLMEMVRAYPPLAQLAGDLIVKAQDMPEADQIAERIKRSIPPNILGPDSEDGKDPEQVQQDQQKAAQAEQMQQAQQQMAMMGAQAETRLKVAQADKAEAEAMKAKIEAMHSISGGPPEQTPQADPTEQARVAIEGFNAITNRIKAVEGAAGKGAPPDLAAHLAPVISAAIAQALAGHDMFAPAGVGSIETTGGEMQ
jgi:hypothetical protein